MNQQSNSAQRVVVTGMGIMSPVGIGAEKFAAQLLANQSGVGVIESLDYTASPGNVGAEVREFTLSSARKEHLKQHRKSIKVMCREIQLGVAAALQAVQHSGIDMDTIDHTRFGVDFGANLMLSPPDVLKDAAWKCTTPEGDDFRFGFDEWGTIGLPSMEPLWLLRYLPNMPACHIGIAVDARGPNNSITLDEASGNLVVAETCGILRRGIADVMITGTTGTRVHPVKTMHSAMWDKLADTPEAPEERCRPFEKQRSGDVVGEGSGSLILETEEHAQQRGATIYATVLGTGSSCVLSRTGQADRRTAMRQAMQAALRSADLSPQDIGHVNANASGSPTGDQEEAAAIQDVFGPDTDIPVTAVKSFLGNSGSGCGPLETAASILSVREGVVLPTLNYQQPDPDCPLNVVHDGNLAIENRVFLKLSVTRQGQASAVIMSVA